MNESEERMKKKNTTERQMPQTKVSSVDFLHFRLHLKLDEVELLFVVTIILVLRILFCGDNDDWLGCGLLLLLRSILLRFGVLLLLLEPLAVAAFVLLSSNVFAVGTILFKLEKSNRYRIVHLSLSFDCEKFMPAKWKPPMPPVQPINSRNTSFTL